MKQDNPFAKLGALDQKLFEDTASKKQSMEAVEVKENDQNIKSQFAGMPEIQNARMPANWKASKLESQTSGKQESQQTGTINIPDNITATEKVTYRFHSEGKYAVEDMKTILIRKHGIKASLEEIAEASILIAYEDLLENQNASKLANKLSGMPANKKAS
jgi:hypothetical protein